jgi:hypothetical protein
MRLFDKTGKKGEYRVFIRKITGHFTKWVPVTELPEFWRPSCMAHFKVLEKLFNLTCRGPKGLFWCPSRPHLANLQIFGFYFGFMVHHHQSYRIVPYCTVSYLSCTVWHVCMWARCMWYACMMYRMVWYGVYGVAWHCMALYREGASHSIYHAMCVTGSIVYSQGITSCIIVVYIKLYNILLALSS